MDKFEISKIIEDFAPLELAEDWDYTGWIVDCNSNEVDKIMLALTVNDDVVRQAHENNCNMIISHHPLFFVPIDYKDINIYCAHTNLDKTEGGTTDELIRVLDLKPTCHCEHRRSIRSEAIRPFIRYVELEKPVSIIEFGQKLKSFSNNIRLVNNFGVETIQKIAFCAGSGSEFIQEVYENGADTFVTGDIKFHTALESPVVIFDIGHFESEIPILKVLENLLKDKVEVTTAIEHSPFQNI